jgi:UDP:flavonoid glycosyltransferase YjiC (YdhE family)
MRFLITTHPGLGHFHPLVPLARALQGAGHEVAVATAARFRPVVEAAGLRHRAAGPDWDESALDETLPAVRGVPRDGRDEFLFREVFLGLGPRLLVPDLLRIAASWPPDLILANAWEFGGALAAERLGIPHAGHAVGFRWTRRFVSMVTEGRLDRLRRDLGLPPDPGFASQGRFLELCPFPEEWTADRVFAAPGFRRQVTGLAARLPWRARLRMGREVAAKTLVGLRYRLLRAPRAGRPGEVHGYLPPAFETGSEGSPPPWLAALSRPLVYVTLGTLFGSLYPELFRAVLEGLRDEPVDVVVTIGRQGDPAALGPVPPNVRIERYVPQSHLLARAAVCVSHGSHGVVVGALRHGVPLVLLPLSAGQPFLAQLCFDAGAAVPPDSSAWRLSGSWMPVIDPERIAPEAVRAAVRRALDDPAPRAAAGAVRRVLDGMPGVASAVERLERLAIAAARPA